MEILELTYPGMSLVGPNRVTIHELGRILHLMRSQIVDAWIARKYMDSALLGERSCPTSDDYRQKWEKDRATEETVRGEYQGELDAASALFGQPGWFEANKAIDEKIRIEVKRRRWKAGELPSEYRSGSAGMHARSVLYALDVFCKSLDVLIIEVEKHLNDDALKVKLSEEAARFRDKFPNLVWVRNSAHHPEDRVRNVGPKKKKKETTIPAIPPAPGLHAGGLIQVGPNASIGRISIQNAVINDRLYNTMENGEIGEVDISFDSIKFMQSTLQNVINLFNWKGHPDHWPG